MSRRDDRTGREEPATEASPETGTHLSEDPEDGDAASATYETPAPWQNPYRDDDWEEGPARIAPQDEVPDRPRRSRLKGALAHAGMLNELTSEAHDFAMDYFEEARGIDDRVAARARKLSVACKLATLAMQLVAAADRHRKAVQENGVD